MSRNLKICLEKLKIIAKIRRPELRKKVLLDLYDTCLYKALNEVAYNVVARKVPLSIKQKKSLRKYKVNIKRLACKTKNKKRRKELVGQIGNGLPFLIPALLSLLPLLKDL